MLQSRFKYLVLIIFLASVVVIVFLQYNSGKSIKNLIRDNRSLLNELQIKNKLQTFQTDIIYGESALRDLVTSDDPQHILETDKDLKRIRNEFAEIDPIFARLFIELYRYENLNWNILREIMKDGLKVDLLENLLDTINFNMGIDIFKNRFLSIVKKHNQNKENYNPGNIGEGN